MRKTLALFIALLFALSAIGASAEEPVQMRVVKCPEQGFSTLCKPEYTYDFHPDGGLTLYLDEPDADPSVNIFKTDGPGADFDAEYYLNNVYPSLVASYGDQVLSAGEYNVYTLSGRQMPGRMSMYVNDGEGRFCFCCFDLRDEYFVRYEVFCPQVDTAIERALTAMAVAVGNFQPDAEYYAKGGDPEPEPAGQNAISCPEMGFSFLADPAYSWNYQDGTGITVFTENEGVIPYVIVYQSEDLIVEAYEYIREQFTPHMRAQYGDDLVACREYEAYEIGGRTLPAGVYTYRLQGYLIDMIRIYDSTGARTSAFTAKYIQGQGDATLAALAQAVATFRPDPNYYDAAPAEPEVVGSYGDDATPMGTFDYTDDILPDGSLVYYFQDLSLRLPASWRGRLVVIPSDESVSFYQRASYDKYQEEGIDGGGFLFGMGACVNNSFTELPAYAYLGFSERSCMNYYLILPSDYSAYMQDDIRAEYEAMEGEVDYVVENAEFYR